MDHEYIYTQDDDAIAVLRDIKANTDALVAAKPAVRSWGWRINNLVWLGVQMAANGFGAAVGAYMAWKLAQVSGVMP